MYIELMTSIYAGSEGVLLAVYILALISYPAMTVGITSIRHYNGTLHASAEGDISPHLTRKEKPSIWFRRLHVAMMVISTFIFIGNGIRVIVEPYRYLHCEDRYAESGVIFTQ